MKCSDNISRQPVASASSTPSSATASNSSLLLTLPPNMTMFLMIEMTTWKGRVRVSNDIHAYEVCSLLIARCLPREMIGN